jgi:hypothetical protein
MIATSAWRRVQERLYRRWADEWVVDPEAVEPDPLTYFVFEDEKASPPEGAVWARVSVKRMPGGPGTLGRPGNRKMDRVGMVFVQLFKPPGQGVGDLSDYGERAAGIFENCRFLDTHDIRFGEVEPGPSSQVENGRWLGLSVEGRFDYEQHV